MSDRKDCKRYDDCYYRNDVGRCPELCGMYKHKDDVRVVRCKDCKYRKRTKIGAAYCRLWDVDDYEEVWVLEDDFCSRGERRNDG